MIKKRILLIALMLVCTIGVWGQKYTISGSVTDKATGETLIGATVLDERSGKGTVTNAYGYYSLTLVSDSVTLRVSYVGYRPEKRHYLLKGNIHEDVELHPSVELKEVVVTADRVGGVKSSQMSAIDMPMEQLKSIPVLMGESDILKALQLMPGVQSGGEGQSGMYVRGGGPDENLFLLDGVPIYNVSHMGGFFSAFNSDAVKNVTLYKGSFPARFGGRLSSVLDVTTNNGNDQSYHGTASIGLLAAKISFEGPIIKDRTTFSVSARRTYADFLIQPLLPWLLGEQAYDMKAGYYFYDLNAKVTHKINDKNRLFASWYMGDDKLYSHMLMNDDYILQPDDFIDFGSRWGNMVGSLRWNSVLGPKLFMNVTAAYTKYKSRMDFGTSQRYELKDTTTWMNMITSYNSGIQDVTGRIDFDYAPSSNHNIKFGGSYIWHVFSPEVIDMDMDAGDNLGNEGMSMDQSFGSKDIEGHEMMAFVEDDWAITDYIKANIGLNLTGFAVRGEFYPSIQPRVSGRWLINEDWSVKIGYAHMTQYLHMLSSSNVSLPTDLWVPVTDKVLPMKSHQVAGGVFYNWKSLVEFSLEGYYKRMHNLLEFEEGSSFFGYNKSWEDKVVMGDGWSYGFEFLAHKTVGEWTGWVGYTWSKTERKFDRPGQILNGGAVFPAKYDRRHDLSIVLMYKPSEKFDCSATWVYSTGNASTLEYQVIEDPEGGYELAMDENGCPIFDEHGNPVLVDKPVDVGYMETRNNYRMPAYHRLDLSVNFHKKLKHGQQTWNISIYNVYNRKNPYLIYQIKGDPTLGTNSKLMQLSLFPILPSVSYIYKF